MVEKDMKSVSDYNAKEQRKYFRGQCFNLAATLIVGSFAGGNVKLVSVGAVYDYAKSLYDEGIERDWVNYGEAEHRDNREINKETGKVEIPIEQKGTLENPLTEKDRIGQDDAQIADETDGVVI